MGVYSNLDLEIPPKCHSPTRLSDKPDRAFRTTSSRTSGDSSCSYRPMAAGTGASSIATPAKRSALPWASIRKCHCGMRAQPPTRPATRQAHPALLPWLKNAPCKPWRCRPKPSTPRNRASARLLAATDFWKNRLASAAVCLTRPFSRYAGRTVPTSPWTPSASAAFGSPSGRYRHVWLCHPESTARTMRPGRFVADG